MSIRARRCPDCGANPGKRCMDAQGDLVNWVHTDRSDDPDTPAMAFVAISQLEARVVLLERMLAEITDAARAVLDRARTHVLGDGKGCCQTCESAVLRKLIDATESRGTG